MNLFVFGLFLLLPGISILAKEGHIVCFTLSISLIVLGIVCYVASKFLFILEGIEKNTFIIAEMMLNKKKD